MALPLARPAVAAGVALALMETLADFGVTSYFGIQTFTTGIYKAWLSMDNRMAAAQLATMLLALVLVLLWLEHRAQRRMRFAAKGTGHAGATEAQPVPLRGLARGWPGGVCTLPVFMGFVAPVAFMLRPLASDWSVLPWEPFSRMGLEQRAAGWHHRRPGSGRGAGAGLCRAPRPDLLTRGVVRLASRGLCRAGRGDRGGLLLPVGWLQAHFPQWGVGALVTTTAVGIVWAYLVRFCAVALQSVQSGYARIPASLDDSARMLGAGSAGLMAQCALAAAAPLYRRRRAAGVCGRDERAARHHGAAPLQQRHPGRGGLPAGARRAPGRGRLPSLALVAVGLVPVILLSRTLRGPLHCHASRGWQTSRSCTSRALSRWMKCMTWMACWAAARVCPNRRRCPS
jgi:iron(III) transport system permease protein